MVGSALETGSGGGLRNDCCGALNVNVGFPIKVRNLKFGRMADVCVVAPARVADAMVSGLRCILRWLPPIVLAAVAEV